MFILHRIFFILNIVFAIFLLISYTAPFISPVFTSIPAYFGLAYPLLLFINILFIIWWTLFLKLKVFISLGIIILGYSNISRFIKFTAVKKDKTENMIRFMSFNCKYFDWWNKETDTSPFFKALTEIKPDILCYQEFAFEDTKRKNYIKKTLKVLNYNNFNFSSAYISADTIHREYGIFLATKFPIINAGSIEFVIRSGNRCQWVDLKRGNDTLRVYNIHLQSVMFNEADHKMLDIEENDSSNAKNFLRKLKYAWIKRAPQAEMVANHIESCRYKVLLCGDFNDNSLSYSYRTVSENLHDAFEECGSGVSQTYMGKLPLRIDYIFGDKNFRFYNYEKNGNFFSDHYSIVTDAELLK